LTRHLTAVPLREVRRFSFRHLSILILGFVLSACGWPGIVAYSEPQQSSLTEEGETVEYLVTIELAPGALDEARRGHFSVRGTVNGSGEDVPVIEVSGGDPTTVGGRMDELSSFVFEWDWELPECANGCETTMSLVFEVAEPRSDSPSINWRALYVIEVPANVESEKDGDLDGVITVKQVP
jgi:hypothetical protein